MLDRETVERLLQNNLDAKLNSELSKYGDISWMPLINSFVLLPAFLSGLLLNSLHGSLKLLCRLETGTSVKKSS